MLDGFIDYSTPAAIFLASYLPADSEESDYAGDTWVGTSHECETPGVIRHSPAWLEAQCGKRGLQVVQLPGAAFDGQFWLRVQRDGALSG